MELTLVGVGLRVPSPSAGQSKTPVFMGLAPTQYDATTDTPAELQAQDWAQNFYPEGPLVRSASPAERCGGSR